MIGAPGAPAASGCSKLCTGNATEYCGGSSRLNVYQFGTVDTSSSSTASSTSVSGTSVSSISASSTSASSSSSSSTTSSPPVATGLPNGWSNRGCHIDNAYGGKILVKTYPDDTQLTPQKCVATCVAAGYNIAGVENGKRMCNNSFISLHSPSLIYCVSQSAHAVNKSFTVARLPRLSPSVAQHARVTQPRSVVEVTGWASTL